MQKKIKAYLKSNFITRPFYMTLYYLWYFGAKTTLIKINQKISNCKRYGNETIIPNGQYVSKSSITFSSTENENGYNSLYIKNVDYWKPFFRTEFSNNDMQETRIIKDGTILPFISTNNSSVIGTGGVYNTDGTFFAGHIGSGEITDRKCSFQNEIEYVPETVVYGGFYMDHYGYMIIESLSRLWWYVENPYYKYKCVFISASDQIGTLFVDLIALLGLTRADIILCKTPTYFNNVIVPDQATYFIGGYNKKVSVVYDAIRDSVKPKRYDKVYLTRTKLPNSNLINEEYFENYYRNQGFYVVAPELLSIKEQVSIMAGVKQLVCTEGTLAHNVVFCQDGIQLTILNKQATSPNLIQLWLNKFRNVRCTYIDVSINFMPTATNNPGCLLMPTIYWKQYISDNSETLLPCEDVNIDSFVSEYLKLWAKRAVFFSQSHECQSQIQIMRSVSLADIIINIHENILGDELDDSIKTKLYELFL